MDWKVKYINYPMQFKNHEKDYMAIINDVLTKGDLILRGQLKSFEENLAKFCGTRFAVGVSNCTNALYLSLYSAGIHPGDEIITVSHTFVATIEAIHHLNAKPVFVDIADDHNINVDLIERSITSKTKAIVPVHLNGRICSNMGKLVEIAERYDLTIIEDAAQALGASYKEKKAGSFGLAGCFSFYPAKLLGAFGDGGAVVTNDEDFANTIKLLRNHGRGPDGEIAMWGSNCRIDNLQAAILDFKLELLSKWIKRRRELANLYNKLLSDVQEVKLPPPPQVEGDHFDVYQNFEVEANNRDDLVKHLNKKGIEVMLPWGGKGVHQFKALRLGHYSLPRTEEFFKRALMLPMYPELKDEQIEFVINTIREFYGVG